MQFPCRFCLCRLLYCAAPFSLPYLIVPPIPFLSSCVLVYDITDRKSFDNLNNWKVACPVLRFSSYF